MLKLYFETHIALSVSTELRNRGLDVVRSYEVGLADASDAVHLDYAAHEKRAIVTIDRDFYHLHSQYLENGLFHAGIFLVMDNPYSVGVIVTELVGVNDMLIGGAATYDDIYNQLLLIKSPK